MILSSSLKQLGLQWLSNGNFISFLDTGPDMAFYRGLCQRITDHQHSTKNSDQSCPDVFICLYKDRLGGYCKYMYELICVVIYACVQMYCNHYCNVK